MWARSKILRVAVLFVGALASSTVYAHGGGLDGRGCHRDSGAGEYHCHQGPHAGERFPSKSAYGGETAGSAGSPGREYDRDDYLPRWADRDDDCMDTRDEVLAAESLVEPTLSDDGCDVVGGRWRGRYTGQIFTNPSNLDIDHIVPLAEAHASGAAAWPIARKRRYANDLEHAAALIAVDAGANRSKGADDPAEWMPPDEEYHCRYLRQWVEVKNVWGLSMDRGERKAIERGLSDCPQ